MTQPDSGSQAREDNRKDLRGLLDDYERELILLALAAAGGHQRRAASSLGLLPSTLSEKMKRLGLRGARDVEHLACGQGDGRVIFAKQGE